MARECLKFRTVAYDSTPFHSDAQAKDGGRFRADSGDAFFAFVDMVPRSGWDGRIRFVKIGDPVPDTDAKAPERPDAAGDDEDGSDE